MSPSSFSLETVFYAANAVEDKIELRLGTWIVSCLWNEDAVFRFKDRLASPAAYNAESAWAVFEPEGVPWHGWFFTRPHTKGKLWNKLRIRKQDLKHPQNHSILHKAPLCGGYCELGKIKNPQDIKELPQHKIELTLSLNLQRYMRHQPYDDTPSVAISPHPPWLQSRDDDRSFYGEEFSFDRADNWIPNTKAWRHFASPAKARKHLEDYFSVIVNHMDSEMARTCAIIQYEEPFIDYPSKPSWNRQSTYYSLNKVETLWEFPSDEPIKQVMEIGGRLIQIKRKGGKVRNHNLPFKEVGIQFNSPCFTIPIAENTELKLYAKTNKRIRFEIVHMLYEKKQRTALLKSVGIEASKDYFQLDELLPLIQSLRKRASKLMNEAMEDIRKTSEVPLYAFSVIDLLSEVSAAVSNQLHHENRITQIQMLLFMLCYQGGFRGNSKSGPFAEAIDQLRVRKVVSWDAKKKFFILCDAYLPAKERLLSKTGDPFLALLASVNSSDGFHKIGDSYVRLRE